MKRWWMSACLISLAGMAGADGMFAGGVATEYGLGERVAGKSGVASTEQKGIIIELPENREALLLQTTYHGPADRFAWVIPVPGRPGKDDVFLASTKFIDALLDNTRPEVHTTINDPRAARPGFARGKVAGEGAVPPGAPEMEGGLQPTVTVHERMEIGDYDVTVLSATGAGVLTDWLTDNGYQIPEDSDDIFAHYVQESWYFVAVRMQPGKVEERPLLEDVAPIGIRFDAEQLVYPLHISRASSREKTALLLLILSDSAVECDQLADARLPLQRHFRQGTCYAAIRRQAVDGTKPAAVCEFRGPEGMQYTDLHYEKDSWGGREGPTWSLGYLWTTRLWTLLDLDELEDLTFSSSTDRRTLKLHVVREGRIYYPPVERVTTTTAGLVSLYAVAGALIFLLGAWVVHRGITVPSGRTAAAVVVALVTVFLLSIFGPVAALPVVLVVALWALGAIHGARRITTPDPPKPGVRDTICGALVAAGMGGFGYVAYLLTLGAQRFLHTDAFGHQVRELWRGHEPTPMAAIVLAVQVAWVLLVVDVVRRGLRGAGRRAAWVVVPWLALLGLFSLIAKPIVGQIIAAVRPGSVPLPGVQAAVAATVLALAPVALAALLLLVSYALVGPWVSDNARRTAQPLAHMLLGLALLGALLFFGGIRTAYAGSPGYISTGVRQLDSALQNLDDMLTRFKAKYGCYPARLEDMLASASPTAGLDSSGNPVPIGQPENAEAAGEKEPPTGPGWPATELPADPLTGRSDTWVYEPTGSPMIDSGGYDIVIEAREIAPAETVATWQPGRKLGPGPPDLQSRLYWRSDRRVALPFVFADERVFNEESLRRPTTVLRRLMARREGPTMALAAVGAHTATVGDAKPGLNAFAWAPDRSRLVYASNGQHGTQIQSNTVFGDRRRSRRLLAGPWPVEVYDLDCHPKEDRWVVVARDIEGDARARIYTLASDGVPRPITQPGNYVTACFSPDGTGLLAVETTEPWTESWQIAEGVPQPHVLGVPGMSDRVSPGIGTLWRLSPDGQRQKRLADSAVFTHLLRGPSGVLVVLGRRYEDSGLLHLDPSGEQRRIALPVPRPLIVDTWLGDQHLAVALMRCLGGSPPNYSSLGDVWVRDLAGGQWRLIARWSARARLSRRTVTRIIVGRDDATGAYVLIGPGTDEVTVCAIRDAEPRLELLLPRPAIGRDTQVQVSLGGEQRKVLLEGFFHASGFRIGDLIATSPGTQTPTSALPVALREGGRMLVGDRWVDCASVEVPVLDDLRASFYAKLRLL